MAAARSTQRPAVSLHDQLGGISLLDQLSHCSTIAGRGMPGACLQLLAKKVCCSRAGPGVGRSAQSTARARPLSSLCAYVVLDAAWVPQGAAARRRAQCPPFHPAEDACQVAGGRQLQTLSGDQIVGRGEGTTDCKDAGLNRCSTAKMQD